MESTFNYLNIKYYILLHIDLSKWKDVHLINTVLFLEGIVFMIHFLKF